MATSTPPEGFLRDQLAVTRTALANERTLLAYARTSIMLVSSGGAVLKVFGDSQSWIVTGWSLVLFGAVVALLGVVRFLRLRKTLQ